MEEWLSQPHVISSSDTSVPPDRRTTNSWSTGIRRKSHAGIKLVVEATLKGSDRLVTGLKDINDTAKEMKVQEMELELRMHLEHMEYNKKKNSMIMENARLALLNQGAVIAAMFALADAI
jgi:hypothetical protein